MIHELEKGVGTCVGTLKGLRGLMFHIYLGTWVWVRAHNWIFQPMKYLPQSVQVELQSDKDELWNGVMWFSGQLGLGFSDCENSAEVSFSEQVVTAHCNSPRRKKVVETKVVEYLEANNFPLWHFDPR